MLTLGYGRRLTTIPLMHDPLMYLWTSGSASLSAPKLMNTTVLVCSTMLSMCLGLLAVIITLLLFATSSSTLGQVPGVTYMVLSFTACVHLVVVITVFMVL